jgi:Sulfotransferase family
VPTTGYERFFSEATTADKLFCSVPSKTPGQRSNSPVFVIGCHRSGTNLLYDILMSSGAFAIYRGILPVYQTLVPRFGSLSKRSNREKMISVWLRSKGFRRTELEPEGISSRILNECRTAGDFIRIVMEAVAQQQNVRRWAVYEPDNVLYVDQIKKEIPNALFVHIIRDGRDIALSLKKMGGFSPLPWDRSETNSLVATALYWQWMVSHGREAGSRIPADYVEIHYEDLITSPRETLGRLGSFIDHDLDYDQIQRAGLGRLSETNSSFRDEGSESVQPLGRWKQRLSAANIAAIEGTVGNCLEENGYQLSQPASERRSSLRSSCMRAIYPTFLGGKVWIKSKTPMGRFAGISELELEEVRGQEPSAAASE